MKKYFKLLTAVLAVGALVSCADELMDSKKLDVKPGDLVATLPSMQNSTRVAVISGGEFVWADDDQIQVYKLDNLNYSKYTLTSGEGQETGVFTKESGAVLSGDDLYAVTQPKDSKTIYGISATDNKTALLTATIKDSYDWDVLDSNGKTAYKVPTPFWGTAEIDGDNINVDFQALTGFLKLDLRALPAGTQAIVVSSHEDFQIQDPATLDPAIDDKYITYTGGSNESLAGTMNAELKGVAALQADDRLHKSDTLRVNIDKILNEDGEDYILYIPIVAQHYDKLYVIAVKSDNRQTYTYDEAEILREFNDITFDISTVIPTLSLTEVLDLNAMGATSFEQASNMIAKKYDGMHTLRVKMNPSTFTTDNVLYIASNLKGQSSVEIEFTGTAPNPFSIVECPATLYSGGDFAEFDKTKAMTEAKAKTLTAEQMAKKRTVRLKFDVDAYTASTGTGTSGTGTGTSTDPSYLTVLLPTSNLELDAEITQTGNFKLLACTTNHVSGYDETNYNHKDAAIIIKGGVYSNSGVMTPVTYPLIEILENSRGDVYIYEEDTQITKLQFDDYEYMPNVRITDALVGEINYAYTGGLGTNEEIAIFTTGSAAILNGITGSDNNKAQIYAYWTGKSLTDNALALGYDCGRIYTAAQLQGVGLAAGLATGGGTLTTCRNLLSGGAPTPKYEYVINDRVNSIWLGGYEFPWIGAQVAKLIGTPIAPGYGSNRTIKPEAILSSASTATTENAIYFEQIAPQQLESAVSIDGNEKNLRNMKLSIKDPYFKDPHKCCTTCGDMAVKVDEDLGLIRCIMTTGKVDVKNINLNDVLLESKENSIDNVGSIVGEIGANGVVNLLNNNSTNVRIETVGDNVGGQYGNVFSKATVKVRDVLVGQEVAETGTTDLYVKATGDNAGGVAGYVNTTANVLTQDATVHIDQIWGVKGSNVGGIYGDMYYGEASIMRDADVVVADIKATQAKNNERNLKDTGNNAGGLIGNAESTGTNLDIDSIIVVSTQQIYAENQNAGGLLGLSNIKTGGQLNIANATNAGKVEPWIDVDAELIKSENGYVGGLVGNLATGTQANIATSVGYADAASKNVFNQIKVVADELAGSHAVGGLLGGQFIPTYIGAANTHKGAGNYIDVTVNDFTNTWQPADFKSTAKANYLNITAEDRLKNCGSFGLLDGFKNQALRIFQADKIKTAGTCTVANANGVMSEKAVNTGRQVISNAKKDALYFYLHKDSKSTVETNLGDQFWGDVNGYVGYDKYDAQYYIDGQQQQGDQLSNVYITYSEVTE
jgi:hypothetical protein